MKFLSAKKVTRAYYQLSVSLIDSTYKRDFQLEKTSFVAFLGIPLIPKNTIVLHYTNEEFIKMLIV